MIASWLFLFLLVKKSSHDLHDWHLNWVLGFLQARSILYIAKCLIRVASGIFITKISIELHFELEEKDLVHRSDDPHMSKHDGTIRLGDNFTCNNYNTVLNLGDKFGLWNRNLCMLLMKHNALVIPNNEIIECLEDTLCRPAVWRRAHCPTLSRKETTQN